jgi:hypothetical protein
MKLPLLAALAALSLYGCASQSSNTREASAPESSAVGGSGSTDTSSTSEETLSPGEASNVTNLEKRDRQDAPTVYEGEATGGSGSASESVKTDDGQMWDVQQNSGLDLGKDRPAPAGAVTRTTTAPAALARARSSRSPRRTPATPPASRPTPRSNQDVQQAAGEPVLKKGRWPWSHCSL